MVCQRIILSGWTSSFRYPAFIVGYQPTLPVPPVSTIYGLISAAAGRWVLPTDTSVGFVFESAGRAVDLEISYELSGQFKYKTNVCRREFLYEPRLYLYLSNVELAKAFSHPVYPLVLGRSTDLAMVEQVEQVELAVSDDPVHLVGTLIPQRIAGNRALVQALPTHFTEEMPRRALGTQPFAIITRSVSVPADVAPVDPEYGWGVYFHGC